MYWYRLGEILRNRFFNLCPKIKESKKQRNVYEKWNLPAGNVNRGESIEEAMRRIIEEEAGLQGSNGFYIKFLNILTREFPSDRHTKEL